MDDHSKGITIGDLREMSHPVVLARIGDPEDGATKIAIDIDLRFEGVAVFAQMVVDQRLGHADCFRKDVAVESMKQEVVPLKDLGSLLGGWNGLDLCVGEPSLQGVERIAVDRDRPAAAPQIFGGHHRNQGIADSETGEAADIAGFFGESRCGLVAEEHSHGLLIQ